MYTLALWSNIVPFPIPSGSSPLFWTCLHQGDQDAWHRLGYIRPIIGRLVKLLGWGVFAIVSVFFALFVACSTVILWFRGLFQVLEWLSEVMYDGTGEGEGSIRDLQWKTAERIAKRRNVKSNLQVDRLLKMATGWDLEDLSLRVSRREAQNDEKLNTGDDDFDDSPGARE